MDPPQLQIALPPPSIWRLPPEIRRRIYRLLLVSEDTIRMLPQPEGLLYIWRPNNLFPSILRTCHSIYHEAVDVLYGENRFRAHRIDRTNPNAVTIRRAKFLIGQTHNCGAKDDALRLANFLDFHGELTYLELEITLDEFGDPSTKDIVAEALINHKKPLRKISFRTGETCALREEFVHLVDYQPFYKEDPHRIHQILDVF